MEKGESHVEKDSKNSHENEKQIQDIQKLKERSQALYDSFGGIEEFKKRNPDCDTWISQAKETLIQSHKISANDPTLEQKAIALALYEHKTVIDQNAKTLPPELKKKYESSQKEIFRNIESLLIELSIPHTKIDIPPLTNAEF